MGNSYEQADPAVRAFLKDVYDSFGSPQREEVRKPVTEKEIAHIKEQSERSKEGSK
jgi:hypothetical protein